MDMVEVNPYLVRRRGQTDGGGRVACSHCAPREIHTTS
jgi:hypothetical protein